MISLVWAKLRLDAQGTPKERCVTAKHAGLKRRKAEDSKLHPHLAFTGSPGTPKIIVLCSLSGEVYFLGFGLCFVPRKAEEGEGGLILSARTDICEHIHSDRLSPPTPHDVGSWLWGRNSWVTQAPWLLHNNTLFPEASL